MSSYRCDGSCSLYYNNGDIEQSADLHAVEWCYAGRYHKAFRLNNPATQPSASTSAGVAVEPKFHYIM